MRRTVIAGLDGSPESVAAAGWAAREAMRRGVGLRLLHAAAPAPRGPRTTSIDLEALGGTSLVRTAEEVRGTFPDLPITVDEVPGQPLPVLFAAAEEAELVVLGSRGVSAAAGFLLGSVALTVAGQSTVPVVLVRAGEEPSDEHRLDASGRPAVVTPYRDVVVGLDLTRASDSVI
ncbi:MAG TPA: universal stress protein, partial [Streptomyces sp.]